MNSPQHSRERALFLYRNALERGDFDTVIAVLKMAERDSVLTEMIEEIAEFDDVPLARSERRTASLFRRSKGIIEVVIRRDPSPNGSPPKFDHSEEENDMNTSFVPARPLQFPDTRRLIFDPVTWAVAILAMILLGAALLFMRASAGPSGRPEIETLSDMQATPVRITADNVDQLQELMVLGRGMVVDMAWSPDGGTLALGSLNSITNGIIWLYDLDELDAQPRLLEGYTAGIVSVTFSPDGGTLATSSGNEIVLWDVATREQISFLEVHSVKSLAFSPDGMMLAGVRGQVVWLWDVQNGEEIAILHGHQESVNSVAFSPDGAQLASGGVDKTVRLWDVASGAELAILEGHEASVRSVAFSPNGAIIASGSTDGTVRLWEWNGATGTQQVALTGHTDDVWDVAFSPDGNMLASASLDDTIRLWDVTTGVSRALEGHTDRVSSIAFSPDGLTLASVSPDETLRLWDMATGAEVRVIAIPSGHQGIATNAVFSPDGTLIASSGQDNTVRLWDVTTGAQRAVLEGHTYGVSSVAFSPDGTTLVSGSIDNTLRLWDVATGESRVLQSHTNAVTWVAYSPDGTTVASSSDDGTIQIWDVATGESRVVEGDGGWGVAYSPDGRTLAFPGPDTVQLSDVQTGASLAVLQGYSGGMGPAIFSPDSTLLVAGGFDGTIWLWNLTTGAEPVLLHGHEEWVVPEFSPDGRLLLTGSGNLFLDVHDDASVRLWDVATRTQLRILDRYVNVVNDASFNLDQTMIAIANGDGTIRLWGIPTQTLGDGS